MLAKAHTSGPILVPIALVPLLVALYAPLPGATVDGEARRLSLRHSILLSMFCYLFSGFQVWPAAQYGWMIFAAGLMYMSLGGGLFGLLVHPFLTVERRWLRVAGVALAWVLADSTRTMSWWSYPMVLGGNLAEWPVMAQLASVGGIWLLDAVVAVFAAMLAEAFELAATGRGAQARRWVAGALALLLGVVGFGVGRMALVPVGAWEWSGEDAPTRPADTWTFSLVQGGHPNWFFARAHVLERLDDVVRVGTMTLVDEALASRPWQAPADFVIVAENAFGVSLPQGEAGFERSGLLERQPAPGTVLMVGATMELPEPEPENPRAVFENAFMVLEPGPAGRLRIADRVYKRQLVPFAESRYRRGVSFRPLQTPHGPLGVLICYESIYPAITEALVDQGADVLVVVTNDAGLRRSYAPAIHARLGTLRSIESGRSMVHASQAGLTFFADAAGRRTPGFDLFHRGVLSGAVTRTPRFTLYTLTGQWWLLGTLVAWFGLAGFAVVSHRRRVRMKAKSVR